MRPLPEIREALERMWPLLTPAQLLHDLFGSKALLKLAAAKHLSEAEYLSLYRPRHDDVRECPMDRQRRRPARRGPQLPRFEAATVRGQQRPARRNGHGSRAADAEEIRTYGHIVVDEVQDLTPMQLRMVSRRSLNGSMTVVGDIAQATGALAPNDWADVLRYLPDQKPSRVIGLSVGYRIPAQIMALANQVMMAATPTLRAPTSVRQSDDHPEFVQLPRPTICSPRSPRRRASSPTRSPTGRSPSSPPIRWSSACRRHSSRPGIEHARATRTGLEMGVTVVPVSVVKGLELDGVVVVEPASDRRRGAAGASRALRRADPQHATTHHRPRQRAARTYASVRYACTRAVRLR